jgi:hypothetical protein
MSAGNRLGNRLGNGLGRTFRTCALVALLTLLPPVAVRADDGSGALPSAATAAGESWLGGLAAIGCGVMVRATIITGGTQVGTIVGAVACCGYMLFDLLVSAD